MSRLLFNLFAVMRLRSGPEDMPPGWLFAILFSLVYLSQGFYVDHILEETGNAPRGLIAVSIQYLVTYILLSLRQLSSRLPQTLTTFAGTGVLFGVISIFLITRSEPGVDQPALAMVWLGVFFWSLAVDAHIYRQAMSISMSMGMLIAVLIFGLNFLVIQMMFSA